MSQQNVDQLHRFVFSDDGVRGEVVQLGESLQTALEVKPYPPAIRRLLAEMMVATSLLTATLKFEGEISLQVRGGGLLDYAVVNGTDQQTMRAVAKWQIGVLEQPFAELIDAGVLAITITPKNGQQYQGIVALDKPTLASCLEAYFEQSEQLATQIILHTLNRDQQLFAAGILLQALPASDPSEQQQRDAFQHLSQLTQTITAKELVELPIEQILHRLYHRENVTLFPPQAVQFYCSCSRAKTAQALLGLPPAELNEILQERGVVATDCHYCGTEYKFTKGDLDALYSHGSGDIETRH